MLQNVCTVSFFGHREVNDFFLLEQQVEKLVRELLSTKPYVEFLVGENGEFDMLVSSVIRRVKRIYRDDNCCHTLILPYKTAALRRDSDRYYSCFDEIEICEAAASAYFKAAIGIRNRFMVDRSDLVVFYLERESGGAFQAYQYAVKQQKSIIKLPLSGV